MGGGSLASWLRKLLLTLGVPKEESYECAQGLGQSWGVFASRMTLRSIGSSLTWHPWSLHTDSLGLSDPLWVRSSNVRDKKVGFSPCPGPRSSVVGWGRNLEAGTRSPSHLCFVSRLAAR